MNKNNFDTTIKALRTVFNIVGKTSVYILAGLAILSIIYILGSAIILAFTTHILIGIVSVLIIIAASYLIFK